jgi:hypothetical protein
MPLVNGLLITAPDVAKAALRDIFETPGLPDSALFLRGLDATAPLG